jgi:thiol-disulfide isomerase/thioredoxin
MKRTFVAGMAMVAVLALSSMVMAGPIPIGSPCPNFTGLETACGKTCSMSDYSKYDVLVVCITCNHCPAAVAYEDRIINFVKKHCTGDAAKVGFVAINVNNNESDRLPAMKKRAEEKGFNFCYAYDPSQKIARELGASVTPEFYVFNKDRKLVYSGAMDDNNNAEKATTNYLEMAVKAALTGGEAPKATRARGCGIQYDKR